MPLPDPYRARQRPLHLLTGILLASWCVLGAVSVATAGEVPSGRAVTDEHGNSFRTIAPEESEGPLGRIRIDEVQGRTTGAFQTSPARISETVAHGTSIDLELRVLNQSGRTATFDLLVAPVLPGASGAGRRLGKPHPPSTSGGDGMDHWVRTPAPSVRLRNLQQAIVPVRIAVPAGAPPGGHYGAIVVRMTNPARDGAVLIRQQIVSDLQVTVPGDIEYAATIESVRVPRIARGALPVAVRVHNDGNIHARPEVTARLAGVSGAGTSKQTDELLPDGEQVVRVRLEPGRHLAFAPVQVLVELENGHVLKRTTQRVVYASDRILAVTGAALALSLLVVMAVLVRRRLELRAYIAMELAREYDEDDDGFMDDHLLGRSEQAEDDEGVAPGQEGSSASPI